MLTVATRFVPHASEKVVVTFARLTLTDEGFTKHQGDQSQIVEPASIAELQIFFTLDDLQLGRDWVRWQWNHQGESVFVSHQSLKVRIVLPSVEAENSQRIPEHIKAQAIESIEVGVFAFEGENFDSDVHLILVVLASLID